MSSWKFRNAIAADRTSILDLLAGSDLPVADVDEHLGHFIVATENGDIIGVIGAEYSGTDALLRSLAVRSDQRGRGLGMALSEELLKRFALRGVRRAGLLTTTAEKFFLRHGFVPVPKESVPAFIRDSREYRQLCPDTAVCMIKRLGTS